MCKWLALLCLLVTPAMAEDNVPETIEVVGLKSLAGIWKVHFPAGISMYVPGLGRGTFAGIEAFCRIGPAEDALAIHCLPWNGSGTASLEDGRLHLAWGVALFRFVIDAPIVTATAFTGAYRLKTFGDSHDAPTPASGRKMALSGNAPDRAGQADSLRGALQAIANGTVPPQDEASRKKFGGLFGGPPAAWGDALRAMGAPVHVIYLGTSSPPATWADSVGQPPAATAKQGNAAFDYYARFNLYDVEFADGQRLCGVHAGEDGTVDNVLCV